jgi:hypothetical protein
MNEQPVLHDERTDAVAGISARLAYLVLYFGVLIIAVVRTMAFRQICVDLLGVIFISSVVGLVHQRVKHVQVLSRHRALLSVLISMAVALAAAGVAFVLLKR